MSAEWITVDELLRNGDLELVQDGNHGGSYPKVEEFISKGVPLITGACLIDGGVDYKKAGFISPIRAAQLRVGFAKAGDVLLTHKGTMGKTAIVPQSQYPSTILNPQITLYRVSGSGRLYSRYLKFFFDSNIFQDLLVKISATSTINTLPIKEQKKLKIPVPSKEVQSEIVGVLGTLDDRITLLRETNATLEAIAQALFKSWFVDFDPVRAKAEGRQPEGMDAATAALFPDSFEESELGLVPSGWRVGCIAELAEQKKGSINPLASPDEQFEHYSLPAFDSGQYPVLELGESIKSNKTPLPGEAVLLSKLNPHIPRVWLPVSHGENAVCSTEFLAYLPKAGASKELIYCLFSSPDFQQQLCQLVTGTSNSHQRVKPDQILELKLPIADAGFLAAFTVIARPIFERVYANRQQAQILTQLRDTLLPRLISGQLRLPEMETIVENTLSEVV